MYTHMHSIHIVVAKTDFWICLSRSLARVFMYVNDKLCLDEPEQPAVQITVHEYIISK